MRMVLKVSKEEESLELKDLRERLASLKRNVKNENEIRYLRGAINHYEAELGLSKTRYDNQEADGSNKLGNAFQNLKAYLIETNTWLSFKLIIMGVAFFYGGAYTNYSIYGPMFELSGILMIGIGIWRIPYVREFFKEVI